ncbi:unnamed protein product [Mycena citricolor]|uniref:Nitroreductase domain-containing protein n=1 Tax=Mycena citricolor TaxID=2018698 RepID=A0AAD2K1R8_9AGAR|nr:unnamed protein product [Mycena citricolor]
MSTAFLAAVAARRSRYALSPKSSIPDEKLEGIIKSALLNAPSSFNSQSARAVLVLGEKNQKLWSLVRESAVAGLDGDRKDAAEKRIDGFTNSYGSVLFWEDQAVVDGLIAKIPAYGAIRPTHVRSADLGVFFLMNRYATQFPVWSQNGAGILQYIVWTALDAEGLGASLQHYGANPALASAIRAEFGLPETWTSSAIMPFGVPAADAAAKSFAPIEDRFKVFKD